MMTVYFLTMYETDDHDDAEVDDVDASTCHSVSVRGLWQRTGSVRGQKACKFAAFLRASMAAANDVSNKTGQASKLLHYLSTRYSLQRKVN